MIPSAGPQFAACDAPDGMPTFQPIQVGRNDCTQQNRQPPGNIVQAVDLRCLLGRNRVPYRAFPHAQAFCPILCQSADNGFRHYVPSFTARAAVVASSMCRRRSRTASSSLIWGSKPKPSKFLKPLNFTCLASVTAIRGTSRNSAIFYGSTLHAILTPLGLKSGR